MRDLVFVAAWCILLPLTWFGAELGVLLWTWTSLLGPADVLFGFGTMIPFAKVAAVPTVLQLLMRRGAVRFRLGPTGWLFLALAAQAVLSQSLSPMLDAAAGWDLCFKFLKILALALAVLWTIHDRRLVHGLLLVICLGIGYIAVDEGIKFVLSGSAHKVLGSASLGDNNQVALDVLLIIPLLQYLYGTAASRLLRLATMGGMVLAVLTVVATFSRGGFVGLVVVALGTVMSSRRRGLTVLLVLAGILAGTAFIGSDWTARVSTVEDAQNDSSFIGRVTAWKVSTALALERPLVGGGFHGIQHSEIWLSQARGFLALDIFPGIAQGTFPRAAHSIYFEMLGDLGFGGLALFLLLLWRAWRDAGRVGRLVRASGRDDLEWAADLAGKLRVSLVTFMVSGGLLSAAYYDIDYLLIGLLAVLRMILSEPVTHLAPRGAPVQARLLGASRITP